MNKWLWNESFEFPLFLMGKFALIYKCFGLQTCFSAIADITHALLEGIMPTIQGFTVYVFVTENLYKSFICSNLKP